ncbi:MAG: hypothetical protein JNK85_10835 [Verrucomicrobiales bacterium]|nr:hypothetical protein [Verrucomicrobiales bacterium]
MRPAWRSFHFYAALSMLCAGGGQCVQANEPRRVVVTMASDSGPGSLRTAIETLNLQGGGEIDLRSVPGAILLESALPEVRVHLRLLGPPESEPALRIDGQGKSSILVIGSGATCEVNRLILTRGFAGEGHQGAAISNAGTVVLRECELTGNRTSGGRGGAIFNRGDVEIIGGTFQSNVVEGVSAATSNLGPGDGFGGALFQEAGSFAATGTSFAFNRAVGGVGNSGFDAPFAGNAAGGAIYSQAGNLRLIQCRVEGNAAVGGAGGSSEFGAGAGGLGRGGVLYVHLGNVEMGDCEFRSNLAEGGAGGGARNGSLGEATGNGGDGAGAVVFCQSAALEIYRCLVVSNVCRGGRGSSGKNGGVGANAFGGAIYEQDGAIEMRQCLLQGNQVLGGLQGGGARRMGAPGNAWGGAMVVRGGGLTIENCTVACNLAQGADAYDSSLVGSPAPLVSVAGGGGLAVGTLGGVTPVHEPQVELRFSTLTDNQVEPSRTFIQKPFVLSQVLTNGWVNGGGLFATDGMVTLAGVICAGNRSDTNADVGGYVASRLANLIGSRGTAAGLANHDLIGVDPRLGPLADHGGPTWTYSLLPGSPALDAIRSGTTLAEDQRGAGRPMGSGWDLGAFEAGPRILSLRLDPDGAGRIEVPTAVATQVVLEYSQDLRNWTPLGTVAEGSMFRDPVQRAEAYYRLRVPGL